LSPFFKTGSIVAYFSLVEKIPESIDLLKIRLSGELIKGALSFKILAVIPSYPQDSFVFKDLIMFPISLGDVFLIFILVKTLRGRFSRQ
jgi:hypothetical protein